MSEKSIELTPIKSSSDTINLGSSPSNDPSISLSANKFSRLHEISSNKIFTPDFFYSSGFVCLLLLLALVVGLIICLAPKSNGGSNPNVKSSVNNSVSTTTTNSSNLSNPSNSSSNVSNFSNPADPTNSSANLSNYFSTTSNSNSNSNTNSNTNSSLNQVVTTTCVNGGACSSTTTYEPFDNVFNIPEKEKDKKIHRNNMIY